MRRPTASEHAPYYSTYVDRVPDRPILDVLRSAPSELAAVLSTVDPQDEGFAYAPGKWSFRQALGHVVDAERVFSFRALHIARADPSPLAGMDQEIWAAASNAGERPLASLAGELAAVREATVRLFDSLDEAAWARRGVASDLAVSVRALAWIVAGHEIHHRWVLEERYLRTDA
jgi:uncharacterized damage-inducible protein DinB